MACCVVYNIHRSMACCVVYNIHRSMACCVVYTHCRGLVPATGLYIFVMLIRLMSPTVETDIYTAWKKHVCLYYKALDTLQWDTLFSHVCFAYNASGVSNMRLGSCIVHHGMRSCRPCVRPASHSSRLCY
jgi:hypothetical protein